MPGNRSIGYGYDANGNQTTTTPPASPAHAFTYNAVDLASSYTPPETGSGPEPILLSYNVDRQLLRRELPTGAALDLSYATGSGRLDTQDLPRGPVSYTYDSATGHVIAVAAPGGVTVSYGYDGGLQVSIAWSGPVPGSVIQTFDTSLRTASLAVNGADPVAFSYDNDDLLTGAGGLTLSRDGATGRVASTTLGSVTDARTHNSFGEFMTGSASFNGTPLYDFELSRDGLGRIVGRTETIGGATVALTYLYDAAGRLAEVQQGGTSLASYTYDDNENRLSLTTPGDSVNATHDAQDRLLQYGASTYGHDAIGQLLTKTTGGQTTIYGYDEAGNLLSVDLPDGTLVEYIVDGVNRRIGKKVDGVLVRGFLYEDRLRPIAELDGSGALVSRFVYADRIITPSYMIKAGATFRIITDHLGSPRLVVDVATGTIVQRLDYDEFGNVLIDTNPGFQPFGFAGGLYDVDTRLVRFGVRDYDAETGRWTSKDALLSAEDNLYAYAANDPVNLIDAVGLAPGEYDDLIPEGDDPFGPRDTDAHLSIQPGEARSEGAARILDTASKRKTPVERELKNALINIRRKGNLAKEAADALRASKAFVKRVPGPVKIACMIFSVSTLAEDARANDQSLVEQAAENALPVEAKTIRETLEGFIGFVHDSVREQFVDLFPAPG
jgi:RHS repeat-associated protein